MAYPIIILGAGASHDYIDPERRFDPRSSRPPLTNSLFDPAKFGGFLKEYLKAQKLSSEAISFLESGKGTLEDYLSFVEKKSKENPDRIKQLIEFQFYLQKIFKNISQKYGHEANNNYKHMLQKIEDTKTKDVCFVNFNYDFLLEENFDFIDESLSSYINNPIKIIKIHGSCNWCWHFETLYDISGLEFPKYIINEMDDFNPPKRRTFYAHNINDEDYSYLKTISAGSAERRYFALRPCIAIPIAGKNWVCPDDHMEALRDFLRKTDRILIIGWKAADSEILSLMQEEFKGGNNSPVVTVVSSNVGSAEEIAKRIEKIVINATVNISKQKGFTKFMDSGECDRFFRDPDF